MMNSENSTPLHALVDDEDGDKVEEAEEDPTLYMSPIHGTRRLGRKSRATASNLSQHVRNRSSIFWLQNKNIKESMRDSNETEWDEESFINKRRELQFALAKIPQFVPRLPTPPSFDIVASKALQLELDFSQEVEMLLLKRTLARTFEAWFAFRKWRLKQHRVRKPASFDYLNLKAPSLPEPMSESVSCVSISEASTGAASLDQTIPIEEPREESLQQQPPQIECLPLFVEPVLKPPPPLPVATISHFGHLKNRIQSFRLSSSFPVNRVLSLRMNQVSKS